MKRYLGFLLLPFSYYSYAECKPLKLVSGPAARCDYGPDLVVCSQDVRQGIEIWSGVAEWRTTKSRALPKRSSSGADL